MALIETLNTFFTEHPSSVIWVGLSGGVDSVALLHALTQSNINSTIKAIHINHQLQEQANTWQAMCQQLCQQLSVELISVSVNLDQTAKESIEALAREARYDVFQRYIQANECLCTAHHENDQAETFLLQLMRGAGLTGLQALLPWQPFAHGFLARPLLNISRDMILDYAKAHHLSWVDDPMNEAMNYDRNYIRHQVLPVLQHRWPAAHKKIAQSARLLQNVNQVLEEEIIKSYQTVKMDKELIIDNLIQLPIEKMKMVLRYWIKAQQFLLPSEKKLHHLIHDVIYARQDACPLVSWKGAEVRRYQNKLYIMKPLSIMDCNLEFVWSNFPEPLKLSNELGIIQKEQIFLVEPKKSALVSPNEKQDNILLKFRRGGEKIKIANQHRTLKNIFQESNIPPWLRDQILLVYFNNEIVGWIVHK